MEGKQFAFSSNITKNNEVENSEDSFTKCTRKLLQTKSQVICNGDMSITETSFVVTKKTDDGNKFINQYMIIKDLGK